MRKSATIKALKGNVSQGSRVAPQRPSTPLVAKIGKSVKLRRKEEEPPKPDKPRGAGDLFPTTIKLPADTKALAQAAAEDAGMTMHAFMVSAVAQVAAQAEKRREFVTEARETEERILRTGKGIPHDAMKAYFKARAEGKNPPMPKAVSWRK